MQPDVLAAAAEAAAAAATQQPCMAAGAQACEQRHPEQQEEKQQQQAQEQPQQQPQEQQEDISEPEGLPEPPSSSALSQEELLDLHKLVSTPWDIIIGEEWLSFFGKVPATSAMSCLAQTEHTPHTSSIAAKCVAPLTSWFASTTGVLAFAARPVCLHSSHHCNVPCNLVGRPQAPIGHQP